MHYPQINRDRSLPALVQFADGAWLPSPERGVDRKMLERDGQEVAIASSIVRYAPGCRFSSHVHARGEEFMVLEGTFSDEHGDYDAGTYVRNPPGTSHAPFSADGCVIFVKLRQMELAETTRVVLRPRERMWIPAAAAGVERAPLFESDDEIVELLRLAPDSQTEMRDVSRGVELFVLTGAVRFAEPNGTALTEWSWSRQPGGVHPSLHSQTGALVWVKRNHLS